MEMSDNDIIALYKAGNKEAFTNLYERYIQRIYRFVFYKTWSNDVTEDIVSAAFIKAYERIGTFDETKGSFSQWLYAIARNTVIDHYRTTKNHDNIDDLFSLGESDRTEEKLDAKESLRKIEVHIAKLNPRQREIVVLRVWEELSYKEIADIVGGSEDSVKMMFSRTIREIRDKYGTLAPAALVYLLSCGVTSAELIRTIEDSI